jgi:hypothetical protein
MCFFLKRKTEPIRKSISRLSDLKIKLEVLVYLADEENKNVISNIVDIVKFMPPSVDPQAIKIENKLEDWFDDLKIQLSGKKDQHKITSLIQKIEIALIERKAYR